MQQGSILNLFLFNVLLTDLHISPHFYFLMYADDLTIISTATTQIQAQAHLQEATSALENWVRTWGLSINPA